jgi:hypothetical protein
MVPIIAPQHSFGNVLSAWATIVAHASVFTWIIAISQLPLQLQLLDSEF